MQEEKISTLVLTAMMTGIITVATMFIKIPVPMTEGYVHLGDSAIFLAVLILGKRNGSMAAGIGSALGDLCSGYLHWMPWTLVIKFFMAFIMGVFLENMDKKGKLVHNGGVTAIELLGMVIAGCEMVLGYYIAASIIYGSYVTPLLSIPWNIGQFVAGMIIASAIAQALYKTPVNRYFAIK